MKSLETYTQKSIIDYHLFPDEPKNPLNEISYQSKSSSASFNGHIAFLDNDDRCWEQRKPDKKRTNKSIIIACSFYGMNSTGEKYSLVRFFAAAADYYDVYFWPGSDLNFSSAQPCLNSAEFWDKLDEIVPEKKEDVIKSLTRQNQSYQKYEIFGPKEIEEIAFEFGGRAYVEFFQDYFSSMDLFTDYVPEYRLLPTTKISSLQDYPACKILKLVANKKDEQVIDLEHFPNLEALFIYGNFSVKTFPPFVKKIHLHFLVEDDSSACATIDFSSLMKLEYLSVISRKPLALKLPPALKTLKIEADGKMGSFLIEESLPAFLRTLSFSDRNPNSSPIKLTLAPINHLLVLKLYLDEKPNIMNLLSIENLEHAPLVSCHLIADQIDDRLIGQISQLPEQCLVDIHSRAHQEGTSLSANSPFANEANFELMRANQNSPVSLFSIQENSIALDGKTGMLKQPVSIDGNLSVTLMGKKTKFRHFYHLNVFDDISLDANHRKLSFIKQGGSLEHVPMKMGFLDDLDALQEALEEIKDTPGLVVGHFHGDGILPGKTYPLPTDQSISKKEALESCLVSWKNAIDLFWDSYHQLFYFSLKENVTKPKNLQILYRYHETQRKPSTSPHDFSLICDPLTFSAVAQEPFEDLFNRVPELSFLRDENLNLEEKLKALIKYCSSFKNESLSQAVDPTKTLDVLWQIIVEKKGSCRHRSKAFMLLASYFLNLKVSLVYSEQHAFCKLGYRDRKGALCWDIIDFGGAPVLDLTPIEKRENYFEYAKYAKRVKPKPTVGKNEVEISNPRVSMYYQRFTQMTQNNHPLNSLDALKKLCIDAKSAGFNGLSPLIVVKSAEDAFKIHALIASDVDLYLDDAKDFSRWLAPYAIEGGRRIRLSGPLETLIEKGGLILVNFDRLSAKEISHFKSIMDTPPTLFGRDTRKVKVIGLIQSGKGSEAFHSRCQSFHLSSHVLNQPDVKQEPSSHQERLEIDLYDTPFWHNTILGKMNMTEQGIDLRQSRFIEAVIRGNVDITLYNCPQDHTFNLLMHRIRTDKLLYNGHWLKVGPSLNISLHKKPYVLDFQNVRFQGEDTQQGEYRCPIYIGLHNWDQLVECLSIEAGQATLKPGFLSHYDSQQAYFYLIDTVSEGDWAILLSYIQTHFQDRKFDFKWAPGVVIPEKGKGEGFFIESYHLWCSNDPELFCADYLNEYPDTHIIDITPQTTLTDLVCEMKFQGDKESTGTLFSYQEQGMLSVLEKTSKTILLNGELSSPLYKSLMPLLSSNSPRIFCNGQWRFLKGKLVSIQPENSVKALTHPSLNKKIYTREDYQNRVFDMNPNDVSYLTKIYTFYDQAKQMDLPRENNPNQALTFSLLMRMIETLKDPNPLHRRNPIKALFHYHYPYGSPAYQKLNHLAKRVFGVQAGDKAFKTCHIEKRKRSFSQLLQGNNHVILIKGSAGVGKSSFAHELEDDVYTDILGWLKAEPSSSLKILFLDEANCKQPGTWNFLNGINRDTLEVYYDGQFYPLTPEHRIVATGNEGRLFDPFFQWTMIFKMPSDNYLLNLLNQMDIPLSIGHQMILIYQSIQRNNPNATYSIRDLKSLAFRFQALRQIFTEKSDTSALFCASMIEFSGSILEVKKRQKFTTDLVKIVGFERNEGMALETLLIHINENLYFPKECLLPIAGIMQSLHIRKTPGKNSILLEGAPGLGKSTLFRYVLESQGFSQYSTDPAKKYYLLSGGGLVKDALHVIQKAYDEGAVLIFDELNVIDPSVEELLLTLLGGVFSSGFLIFASQNSSDNPGCEMLSPALRNRFCIFHIEPYSDESLRKLAKQRMGEDGEPFFDAYQLLRKSKEKDITMRTFFKAMPEKPRIIDWGKVKLSITIQMNISRSNHLDCLNPAIKMLDSMMGLDEMSLANELLRKLQLVYLFAKDKKLRGLIEATKGIMMDLYEENPFPIPLEKKFFWSAQEYLLPDVGLKAVFYLRNAQDVIELNQVLQKLPSV